MSRLSLVLCLGALGCAVDQEPTRYDELPSTQAALPQVFSLSVAATVAGQPITFSVAGLPIGTPVRIARAVGGGISPGPCPPVLGGECLDINGPQGLNVFPFTLTANSSGEATRTLTLPAGVPDGTPVAFQAVSPGLGTGSNPVTFVTGPTGPTCNPDDSFEPNGDALNDALGTPPTGFVGELCAAAPYDWYVFDLTAGQTLDLTLSFTHTSSVDLDLWAFDAPQANLNFPSFLAASTSTDDDEFVSVTAAADGPVYVFVYNWAVAYDGSTSSSSYGLDYTITP